MKRTGLSTILVALALILGCGGGTGGDNSGNSDSGKPGSLDSSFTSRFNDNEYTRVTAVAIQSDGKILVGGEFNRYGDHYGYNLVRLNTDGSVDTSFNTTLYESNLDDLVTQILIQDDGKIIIAGTINKFGGAYRHNMLRLNKDGTIDTTFNIGTGFDGAVTEVMLLPGGKILVSGQFPSYNGSAASYITRLNSDGTIDSTFTSQALSKWFAYNNAAENITTLAVQKDGKILVGGTFRLIETDKIYYNIARLNADGTTDLTFDARGTNGYVSKILLKDDGKIIIAGSFTKYGSDTRNRIACLNADGTPDTLNTGTGFDGPVSDIKFLDSGKILACGNFTSFNGTSRGRIARLNSDGSLDPDFYTGTGADGSIVTFGFTGSNKMIIGGYFKSYDNKISYLLASIYY